MAAILALFCISCKKSNKSGPTLNSTDQQFVTSTGYINVSEINAGYLASTNNADTTVVEFGHLMVNDYGSAQSALVLIADNAGFTVLSSPDSAHQKQLDVMQNLTALAFDTTYLRFQINDDQAEIALFQQEQTNGQSSDLKSYVSKYLPILQSHLTTADSLITKWEH